MAPGRVFVVDDEPDNLDFLTEIITAAGYEVEAALDGSSAIDRMREAPPDLAFLDIQMPRMNGFQVLKVIRETESLANVPVVFLSAIGAVTGEEYDSGKIEARYGVRPDAFVSKPIRPDEILAQLERFAKRKGAES